MEDVLKIATWGMGATLAREMNISPQGWSSKIRNQPLHTIKRVLLALRNLGKKTKAQLVIEDFLAFVRVEFENVRLTPLSMPELVGSLHVLIRVELEGSNRVQILAAWRRILVIASQRVRELSKALDGEHQLDYGIAR